MAGDRAGLRRQAVAAGVIGALAGAALPAHPGRKAIAAAALAGAGAVAAVDAMARARQRPGQIPALWSRIVASGAIAAPAGWVAQRITGVGPLPVATAAGAAAGALGLRPQKGLLRPLVRAAVGPSAPRATGALAAAGAVVAYRTVAAAPVRGPELTLLAERVPAESR